MTSENPYQSLFWDMITSAQAAKASDIHIQPTPTGVLIRFRIFGELSQWAAISESHRIAFLQESKRLCQCSLAISGRTQDSRISLPGQALDIRVSLIPSLFGEKLVMRLLDQTRSFSLVDVGLSAVAYQAIQDALAHKTGVNLLTGPTGSGKTTLLYSAIANLDRAGLNIITIEDPVEYTFAGITQVQVTPRLTMNDALRAILRQDPDIILLGEVRDSESAALCFQAASTGHLVLSTLHANSAREAATRLTTLGVDRDLIRSCLKFTSAQRLLPKLCTKCRFVNLDPKITVQAGDSFYSRNLSGCESCHNGAVGRIPILEFIEWRSETNSLSSEPHYSITLKETAFAAAVKGEVDIYDALAIE